MRARDEMLDTPHLIIDAIKMEDNIRRMARLAESSGVDLRPHAKTHKLPPIARKQLEHGAAGITVAKVSEAEVMAEAGIGDIFVAYPMVIPSKIERAMKLQENARLIVGVDSLVGARLLSETAAAHSTTVEVRLEVDTGLKRTGVPYGEALDLALRLAELGYLDLLGLYTHRGAVLQDGTPTLDLERAGTEEAKLMTSLAEEIRQNGISIEDVSLGSTPTAEFEGSVEGVTEIRPGTYVFYDRMQARMGVCSLKDCAAAVVSSVISRPSKDLAVIDAGSKALATDIQPGISPLNLEGFGHLPAYPGAVLERLTEEHGMLRVDQASAPSIGETVEIIPNHICSTVNLYNNTYLRGQDGELEELRIAARGMVA